MARALSKLSFELPKDFKPSEFDVVCSWARQNFTNAGNKRLRDIIAKNTLAYKQAKSKVDKGKIIDSIVNSIVAASPSQTGFVKHDKASGRWLFIGLDKAKDKVGHALRQATKDRSKQPKSKKGASAAAGKGNAKSKRAVKTTTPSVTRARDNADAYAPGNAHIHHYHPPHSVHRQPHHHPSAYASWYANSPYPPPSSMEYYRHHSHHHHHSPPSMEGTARHGLQSLPPQQRLNHPGASVNNMPNDTIHEHQPDDGRRLSTSSSSLPSLRQESPPHHHPHHHHHHLAGQNQHHHHQQIAPPIHPYPYNNEYNTMPQPLGPPSAESPGTLRGSPTSVIREAHTSYNTEDHHHHHLTHHHNQGDHLQPSRAEEDPEKYYHNPAMPSSQHGHVAPSPYPYSHYNAHNASPQPSTAPMPASPSPLDAIEPTPVEDAFADDDDDDEEDDDDDDHSHHLTPSSPLSVSRRKEEEDTTSPLDDMNSQYHHFSPQHHYFHHHPEQQQQHHHHHSYANAYPAIASRTH